MADFRAELARRGVYRNGKPVQTAAEQRKPRGTNGGRRESWRTFCGRIVEAVETRLARLADRKSNEEIVCMRCAHFGERGCGLCNGTMRTTVGKLRAHYSEILAEYMKGAV
jgi:hypothetical protein